MTIKNDGNAEFAGDVTTSGYLYANGSGGYLAVNRTGTSAATTLADFSADGAQKIEFKADGSATFAGDVTAPNLVSEYETGSWTPTDRSGGSQNAFTSQGRYTRVGNLVFCTFDITWPTTSDTQNAAVSLPFTALGDTTNLQGSGSVSWTDYGANVFFYSGSYYDRFNILNTTNNNALINSQLSGHRIIGSFTYRAA